MQRKLFQLFNLLMACTILVSSTGFGLVERSCHMRGKTVYLNLKEAEARRCAADEHPPAATASKVTVSKTPCCQDATSYEHVDVTSSLTQLVAKFLKTLTQAIGAGVASVMAWLIETVVSADSVATVAPNVPPLPAGRSLLALIQRFLI